MGVQAIDFFMSLRLVLLIFAISVAGAPWSLGDEKDGFDAAEKFVPRDQYELEYLGLLGNNKGENLRGVFQLTWKGKNAVGIAGFFVGKPTSFVPIAHFSYHFRTDWELVPIPLGCGFGMSELTIQPFQSSKLIVDMSWLEADFQKPLPVEKAKRAALLIGCHEGLLVSSEFPLPLAP